MPMPVPTPEIVIYNGSGPWAFVKLLGDSHVPTRLTATGLERPGDIPRGQLLSRTWNASDRNRRDRLPHLTLKPGLGLDVRPAGCRCSSHSIRTEVPPSLSSSLTCILSWAFLKAQSGAPQTSASPGRLLPAGSRSWSLKLTPWAGWDHGASLTPSVSHPPGSGQPQRSHTT